MSTNNKVLGRKRKRDKDSKGLTSYSKRVVLDVLKEINCNSLDQYQLVRHFRDKSTERISNIIGWFPLILFLNIIFISIFSL